MVQQIRRHGQDDHMPSGADAIPWLGDYPFLGGPTANQGIHMIGTLADRAVPSLGTQTGADGAVTGTAFTAASGRFTTNDTGMTLTAMDTGVSPPVAYTFTVTYVSPTALTLSSFWTGVATSSLSWVLTGRGPSNAGLAHISAGTNPGGGPLFVSDGTDWVQGAVGFNFDNEGGYFSVITNSTNPGSLPFSGSLVLADLGGSGFQELGTHGILIYEDHSGAFPNLTWTGVTVAPDPIFIAHTTSGLSAGVITIQFAGTTGDFVSFTDIASGNAEYARVSSNGLGVSDVVDLGNGIDFTDNSGNGFFFDVAVDGGFTVHDHGTAGVFFQELGTGGIELKDQGGGGIILLCTSTGDITLNPGASAHLVFDNIPTSNPGGTNRVWNNGGVLNIT